MEDLLVKLFGWSRTTYFSWKKENRPIINLVLKYLREEDIEEFLDTGKISKFEAFGSSKNELESLNNLLIDNAIYSAKLKLATTLEVSLQNELSGIYSKNILEDIVNEMKKDKYSIENSKEKLIDRIKGYEAGITNKNSKILLSKLIDMYFSKIEVFALIEYQEEVLNYIGYFTKN